MEGDSGYIWVCFNFNGVGLCNAYTGRINQHTYIETLENCMALSAKMLIDQNEWWQSQQDISSAHTAHIVKAWVEEREINILTCPAWLPYFNPTKPIWVWMDKELVKVQIMSISSLKQERYTTWGRVNRNCNNLANSMQSLQKSTWAIF